MTPPVSHTPSRAASGDNRRGLSDALSTTALLRRAQRSADCQIPQAIQLLRSWALEHKNAAGAIRVLTEKVRRHPGACAFVVEQSGFVRVIDGLFFARVAFRAVARLSELKIRESQGDAHFEPPAAAAPSKQVPALPRASK